MEEAGLSNGEEIKKIENCETTIALGPSQFVIRMTAVASLGGILFGYDVGVVAVALPQLTETFHLNIDQEELVVSIFYIGGGIGAIFGGTICDYFGRKTAILFTDIFFMAGAVVLFTAPSFGFVILGRLIVGFAVAISGIADVSYLHEMAPTNLRGSIVSVNEVCFSLGFLFAFCAGEVFDRWRMLFAVSGAISFLQFIGMLSLPESPVWLEQQGRHEESILVLQKIYGKSYRCKTSDNGLNSHTGDSFNDIKYSPTDSYDDAIHHKTDAELCLPQITTSMHHDAVVETSILDSSIDQFTDEDVIIDSDICHNIILMENSRWNLIAILSKISSSCTSAQESLMKYRKQAWITLFLAMMQQFCGQLNVLSYAPTIFDDIGNEDSFFLASISSHVVVFIGIIKFLTTALVIWKIEKIGRRSLLLLGVVTITSGLLLVMIAFSIGDDQTTEASSDLYQSLNYTNNETSNGISTSFESAISNNETFNGIFTSFEGAISNNETSNGIFTSFESAISNNETFNGISTSFESAISRIENVDISNTRFICAFVGVVLVVSGYSASFGPLTWLVTSELFPAHIRGRALGIMLIISNICASVVTSTFLSLESLLGGSNAVFGLYSCISLIGLVFVILAIPDTGDGQTVEQIEGKIQQMFWWRNRKNKKQYYPNNKIENADSCNGCMSSNANEDML